MPLISMYERDNSRIVYSMLSERAVQHFDTPPTEDTDRLLFKSLARLLEHYRYDAFWDQDPIGILDAAHPQSRVRRAHISTRRTNFADVRSALEGAHVQVFGHKARDEVVEFLQGILAHLISGPQSDVDSNAADRDRAKQFFAAFSTLLRGNR